jgi:hypothetical protein
MPASSDIKWIHQKSNDLWKSVLDPSVYLYVCFILMDSKGNTFIARQPCYWPAFGMCTVRIPVMTGTILTDSSRFHSIPQGEWQDCTFRLAMTAVFHVLPGKSLVIQPVMCIRRRQSNLDTASLTTAICGGMSRLETNLIRVQQGIYFHRFLRAWNEGGSISGFDCIYFEQLTSLLNKLGKNRQTSP